jgi:hypothetical protein
MQLALTFNEERNPVVPFWITADPLKQLTFKSLAKSASLGVENRRKSFFITGPATLFVLKCVLKLRERLHRSLLSVQEQGGEEEECICDFHRVFSGFILGGIASVKKRARPVRQALPH